MTGDRADLTSLLTLAHRHHQAGRLPDAERLYRSILATEPGHPEANHLLGVLAYQTGRHDAAAQLIAKAILADGTRATYLNNLGLVLEAQGNRDAALMVYRQALALDPGFTASRFSAAGALEALGRLDEAVTEYDHVLAAHPDHADAWNSRGLALHALGRLGDALASFDRARALDPAFAEAENNRGNTLEAQGRIDEAQAAYRQALALKPDFAGAHSNLLLALQYDPDAGARAIFAAHREWQARHAAGLEADPGPVAERHSRGVSARGAGSPVAAPQVDAAEPADAATSGSAPRLRIGYVSADFCSHPVAAFFEPLLRQHDRDAFEVFCYSNVRAADPVTRRLESTAGTWRTIRDVPDERVAGMIREDGIDILVDLSGHTAGNRLLVLARKPAPVQITYLGYPGTTGLDAVDYRLSDVWTDPPGATDDLHTEEVLRIPGGSLAFEPPRAAPDVAPLPDLAPGHVTFASFNNAAKISSAAVALWSRVLRELPAARLSLKAKSLGDRSTVARLERLFADQGIAPGRIDFASWAPSSEAHLAAYGRAHIALDTLPYSGCTTTCEALWMGVPVVTLAGETARSRMSLAVLNQVGWTDGIADTEDTFVKIATGLAHDIDRLRALRADLRERVRRSSLLDAAGFTRRLESAYRDTWQRHLQHSNAACV